MKAFLSILASLFLVGVGTFVLITNAHGTSLPVLVFSGLAIAVGLAIAIPTRLEAAIMVLVPYLPDSLVGGRRHTDPPTKDGGNG